MKIGELFIELTTKGNTKNLDKTLKTLEKAKKENERALKLKRDTNKATDEEEKKLVKENATLDKQIEKTKGLINKKQQAKAAILGAVKGIGAFIASATLMYHVVDRMVTSLARANQEFISFHAQTGISFASLNKYASAASAVNFNATPEQMAGTMSRLASNLYDIRMGRGDISPYQELAFVGGKAFNPMGMNVEQLIEATREAIKGVDDIQATNIISRMGFSPEDLLMLRMSRAEFEKIQSLFLSGQERQQMNKYALEIKKMRLEFELLKDRALLRLMPIFEKISQWVLSTTSAWTQFGTVVAEFTFKVTSLHKTLTALLVIGVLLARSPLIGSLILLYAVIEDIAFGLMGYKSWTGAIINFFYDMIHIFDNFPNIGEGIKNTMQDLGASLDDFAKKGQRLNVLKVISNAFGNLGNTLKMFTQYNPAELGTSIAPGLTPSTSQTNTTTNNNQKTSLNINVSPDQLASTLGVVNNEYNIATANFALGAV